MTRPLAPLLCAGLIAALLAAAAFPSCKKPCHVSDQCSFGQHCDFISGDCVKGCARDSDCPAQAERCDTRYGQCVPPEAIGTSTTADAGAARLDAGADASPSNGADASPSNGADASGADAALRAGSNDGAAGDAGGDGGDL